MKPKRLYDRDFKETAVKLSEQRADIGALAIELAITKKLLYSWCSQNIMSKEQTKIAVFEYIDIWYRKNRRRSYLDYLTIPEFNEKHNKKNKNINNAA